MINQLKIATAIDNETDCEKGAVPFFFCSYISHVKIDYMQNLLWINDTAWALIKLLKHWYDKKKKNDLIQLKSFRLTRMLEQWKHSWEPLRQTFLYLSEWNVIWIPSSFTDPASIFVSSPSPRLHSTPSLPPSVSLHLFPFFHCEQLTAVSLKSLYVSWVVLSYPACTATIWCSVGSGWAHTFDVGRE